MFNENLFLYLSFYCYVLVTADPFTMMPKLPVVKSLMMSKASDLRGVFLHVWRPVRRDLIKRRPLYLRYSVLELSYLARSLLHQLVDLYDRQLNNFLWCHTSVLNNGILVVLGSSCPDYIV